MNNYTKKSGGKQTNLTPEQLDAVIDLVLGLQEIRETLDRIGVINVAKRIAGISKQGLYFHMDKRKGGTK